MICIIDNEKEVELLNQQLNISTTIIVGSYLNRSENSSYNYGYISVYFPLENLLFIFKLDIINYIFNLINNINIKNILYINLSSIYNILNNINYKFKSERDFSLSGLFYSKNNYSVKEYLNILQTKEYVVSKNKLENFILTRYNKYSSPSETVIAEYLLEKSKIYYRIYTENKSQINSQNYKAYIKRLFVFKELETNQIYFNKQTVNKLLTTSQNNKTSSLYNMLNTFSKVSTKFIQSSFLFSNSPTGRLSCKYKNINLLALNKENNIRSVFESRFKNGKLVEFDYDGMHLRLIANLVDFDIPENVRAHEYVAKLVYGDKISDTKYTEIKQKIFHSLYGSKSVIKNDLFNHIDNFRNSNKIYTAKTVLNRSITKNIPDDKKLNYLIQMCEVDYVTLALEKINNIVKEHLQSKPILYSYDGFVFDVHPDEFNMIVKENIFEIDRIVDSVVLPFNISCGNNYQQMNKYNKKES